MTETEQCKKKNEKDLERSWKRWSKKQWDVPKKVEKGLENVENNEYNWKEVERIKKSHVTKSNQQ